ncbi:hypothetical protein [Colwellia sp. Bg11-12]|uniref:hypothetical protein n=1 Tax=Colwellia sp. Bg11-12 TaxID=2759817 RepID=UPI0015F5176D|nr:hypothetical protein [Colwellia sp. Bg11-12]MBA6262305.1 hypothetical protein [Colwellia sp. Bg11-12]
MNKLSSHFEFYLSIVVLLAMWGCGYFFIEKSYDFWANGVEKEAHIVSLDYVSLSARGGDSYYYNLEINRKKMIKDFPYKLAKNSNYSVLHLEVTNEVMIGNSDSNIFDIFAYHLGSKFTAITVILFLLFLPYLCYRSYLSAFVKKKNAW